MSGFFAVSRDYFRDVSTEQLLTSEFTVLKQTKVAATLPVWRYKISATSYYRCHGLELASLAGGGVSLQNLFMNC